MAITGGSSYFMKGNNNSRRRSYGTMLFMGCGAALLGVLILQMLRERRIYNLIVKEKDQRFVSLKLLFQKEKDYSRGMRRKNGELSTEIFNLRNEKSDLDKKLIDMQSTIDLLEGKLKTMEVAIEKQKVIKLLTESLKQKETYIEELKRQLQNPKKVWSVSSDDPSRSNIEGNGDRRETIERKAEKLQNVQNNNNTNAETKSSFGNETRVANSTDAISYHSTKNLDTKQMNSRAHGVDENLGTTKVGMQMNREIQDRSDNGNNIKGKRWRTIAKNRGSDKEGQGGFKSRVKRISSKSEVSQHSNDGHQFGARNSRISLTAKSSETLETEISVNTTTSGIMEEAKTHKTNNSK